MTDQTSISFFVYDVEGGKVGVTPMLPSAALVQGNVRILRIDSEGTLPYFKSRMTPSEFDALLESLKKDGHSVELSNHVN